MSVFGGKIVRPSQRLRSLSRTSHSFSNDQLTSSAGSAADTRLRTHSSTPTVSSRIAPDSRAQGAKSDPSGASSGKRGFVAGRCGCEM